jgi:hypothetical protein
MGILGWIGAAILAFVVFGFFFRVAASLLYVGLVIGIIMFVLNMFMGRRKNLDK